MNEETRAIHLELEPVRLERLLVIRIQKGKVCEPSDIQATVSENKGSQTRILKGLSDHAPIMR